MSADNYIHIVKTDDGKYRVEDRSASCYYADEGHTVEALQAEYDVTDPGQYVIDESWIVGPEHYGRVFATLAEADAYAHSEYSEYGVSYGFEVERTVTDVAAAVPVEEKQG